MPIKNMLLVLLLMIKLSYVHAKHDEPVDMYFCTASDTRYYDCLLNLIGSIHKTNFENIKEIAVFNLGLTDEQITNLNKIQKVKVCKVELTHPDLLKKFNTRNWGNPVPGWYAWKPVVIKQALDMYPHVLYLDAGTTVLKNLDNLFKYIKQSGYFLSTIGDDRINNKPMHPVKWQTIKILIEKFNLHSPENRWILDEESIMASLIGVSKTHADKFADEFYEFSKDLRYFADDGSTPDGFGNGRHDQAILTLLAYTKNLTVFKLDHTQNIPIYLNINNIQESFYLTWNASYVSDRTEIYHSRCDLNYNSKKSIKYNNE